MAILINSHKGGWQEWKGLDSWFHRHLDMSRNGGSATDKYLKLHLFLCLFAVYFARACACVCVSIYAWVYLYAHACTSVCAYMCTYEHVFVHMFACLYMCACVSTCAHAISWVWRSETTCLSSCRTELCSLHSVLQIWWQFLYGLTPCSRL